MGGEGRNKCLRGIICLALVGCVAAAAWYFLGKPSNLDELNQAVGDVLDDIPDIELPDIGLPDFGNFTDVLENITEGGPYEDLWDLDPYLSNNSTQSWPTNGQGGLSLELQNACDDTWTDEFEMAVADWDDGVPDALTLTTKDVEVDHSCQVVNGVMKVCNGNFGDTGWLGINEVITLVSNGQIQSSVAKMNEYYLLNADEYERQYTMCHEIGHGFGLPHTDESFTNPDLGNCMDYTVRPKNNLHPDSSNYNRLASLYGTVPNATRALRQTSDSRREVQDFSFEVQDRYLDALEEFHSEERTASGWGVLREHSSGASYVRRLSEEYKLTVHVLNTLPTTRRKA